MTSIGERNRGPAIGQQNAGQQNAGQPFTVPNSNGRQQGLPGLSNSTNRNIGQGNSGNQRQDNETYRREFSNNALRFDTNSDGQLAANELTNLFLVLASSLQLQQTNYYNNLYQRQNNQASAPSTTTTSVTHSTSGYGQPFANVNQRFAQRQDMRQAAFLFLQMAMQFDSNGDGLLSQAELLQLAGALIANDMNLLNAAGGISGLQIGSRQSPQQSLPVTTTTRQTTRMTANSPARFGQQYNNIRIGTVTQPNGNIGRNGSGRQQSGQSPTHSSRGNQVNTPPRGTSQGRPQQIRNSPPSNNSVQPVRQR